MIDEQVAHDDALYAPIQHDPLPRLPHSHHPVVIKMSLNFLRVIRSSTTILIAFGSLTQVLDHTLFDMG